MNSNLKNILLHYSCAIFLVIVLQLVLKIISFNPFIGSYYLFFILGGLILFYDLTNFHKFILTILNFVINFIAWTAEQVNIEQTFHHTPLYQSEDYGFLVVLFGAFLWATNKLIIDYIFRFFKAAVKDKMKFETLLERIINYNS